MGEVERYGKVKVSTIRAAYNDMRSAIRAGDMDRAQEALDRYEQWAEFVFDERHARKIPEESDDFWDGGKPARWPTLADWLIALVCLVAVGAFIWATGLIKCCS